MIDTITGTTMRTGMMKHPAVACVVALIGAVLMLMLWSESRKTWSVQSHRSVDLKGNHVPAPALRYGDELVGSQFFAFGSHRALVVFAVLIVGSLFAPGQSGRVALAFLGLATLMGAVAWARWYKQYLALEAEFSGTRQGVVSYIGTDASDNALLYVMVLGVITVVYWWSASARQRPNA